MITTIHHGRSSQACHSPVITAIFALCSSAYPKNDSGLTPLGSSHLHGGSSVSLPGDFQFDHQQQQQQQQNSCQQNNGGTGTGHSLPQETMHLDCERR